MSFSYTNTQTQTFTVTNAKHLASKVATDLKRIQRFYGEPSDVLIAKYEEELVELLKNGYLDSVTYGFKKDGNWIEPTVRYTANELYGMSGIDDDPGKIKPGANTKGATFGSYLIHTQSYYNLSQVVKDNFEKDLPFQRSGSAEPGVTGYFASDKTYSSGSKSISRSSVKSF